MRATGTPAIPRTKGFPKGRTAQVAPALRKLNAMRGLQLDLLDTEWHILQRAKDFAELQTDQQGFLNWRRDRQWLTQLMPPLQPLIALPRPPGLQLGAVADQTMAAAVVVEPQVGAEAPEAGFGNGAFP